MRPAGTPGAWRAACIAILACGAPAALAANGDELLQMSLEELIELRVSVSNRASETPRASTTAISIITADDIRNSGLHTLPELIRAVPGFRVQRIDGIEPERAGLRYDQADGRMTLRLRGGWYDSDTQDTRIVMFYGTLVRA